MRFPGLDDPICHNTISESSGMTGYFELTARCRLLKVIRTISNSGGREVTPALHFPMAFFTDPAEKMLEAIRRLDTWLPGLEFRIKLVV